MGLEPVNILSRELRGSLEAGENIKLPKRMWLRVKRLVLTNWADVHLCLAPGQVGS